MTKNEFLQALYIALSPLEPAERDRSLAYYAEVIDDKREEGEQEMQIIAAFGPVEEIAKEIIAETPVQEARKKPIGKALPLALIIAGSPLWFPLLMAGMAVLLAMYMAAWALIISLFAVVFSLFFTGVASIGGLVMHIGTNAPAAFGILGVGFICTGLGLLCLFPCIAFAKWLSAEMLKLCKSIWQKATIWLKGVR